MPMIDFKCGHKEWVDVRFTSRADKEEFYANIGNCPNCEKIEIATEPRKENLELPTLQGSDKQVKWANEIRAKVVAHKESAVPLMKNIARNETEHYPDYIIRMLDRFIETETSAANWIEAFKPITSQYSDKPAEVHVLGGMAQHSELFGLDISCSNFLYDVGKSLKR